MLVNSLFLYPLFTSFSPNNSSLNYYFFKKIIIQYFFVLYQNGDYFTLGKNGARTYHYDRGQDPFIKEIFDLEHEDHIESEHIASFLEVMNEVSHEAAQSPDTSNKQSALQMKILQLQAYVNSKLQTIEDELTKEIFLPIIFIR